MLVVFAIIMALALASFPMMGEAIEASKLRGIAQGTVSMMRLARMQAIKSNGCGLVEIDATRRQVASYLDQDCDPTTGNRLLGTLAFPAGINATKNFTGDVTFRGTGRAEITGTPPPTPTITFKNRGGTVKDITVSRTTGKIKIIVQ